MYVHCMNHMRIWRQVAVQMVHEATPPPPAAAPPPPPPVYIIPYTAVVVAMLTRQLQDADLVDSFSHSFRHYEKNDRFLDGNITSPWDSKGAFRSLQSTETLSM